MTVASATIALRLGLIELSVTCFGVGAQLYGSPTATSRGCPAAL
jgi:hypothetical protein